MQPCVEFRLVLAGLYSLVLMTEFNPWLMDGRMDGWIA